jgi:hypothetical protein
LNAVVGRGYVKLQLVFSVALSSRAAKYLDPIYIQSKESGDKADDMHAFD